MDRDEITDLEEIFENFKRNNKMYIEILKELIEDKKEEMRKQQIIIIGLLIILMRNNVFIFIYLEKDIDTI